MLLASNINKNPPLRDASTNDSKPRLSESTVRASISTASETFGKDNSSYRRINFYNPSILHQSAMLENILQMMMLCWKICVVFFAA
jgi:hypothetical protein